MEGRSQLINAWYINIAVRGWYNGFIWILLVSVELFKLKFVLVIRRIIDRKY